MESLLELWRSLSAELQGAVIGGALGGVGVVTGVLLERFLRRLGKIRYAFGSWNLNVDNRPPSFSFIGKFFNERDVDIGLRDIRVVFYSGKEEKACAELYFGYEAALHPHGEPGGARHREEYTGLRAEALNLPSRQWFVRPLIGRVDDLQGSDRAVFKGYLPKGKPFEREIARWRAPQPTGEASRQNPGGRGHLQDSA